MEITAVMQKLTWRANVVIIFLIYILILQENAIKRMINSNSQH